MAKATKKVKSSKNVEQKVEAKKVVKSVATEKQESVDAGSISFKAGRIIMNKAIGLVSLGLPSKDYGDATSGIMLNIEKKKPDELTLCTNSLEVFIKTKIKLDEKGTPGVVVPNGNIMTGVVSRLKAMKHPIGISFDDDEQVLSLSCGKEYDGQIAHYDPVGFFLPIKNEDIEELPTMSIPVRLIKRALNEVAFACSKDKTNIQLTGIFFDQSNDGMNIVCSDSLRISAIQYRSKINNPQSVIINIAHLELMRKIFTALEVDDNSIVKLYIAEDMAYFIVGDTTVGFQTYGNKYFEEYKQFVLTEDKCKITMTVNREQFLTLLDLAVSHNASANDAIIMKLVGPKQGVLENKPSSSSNINAFEIPFDLHNVKASNGEKPKKFSVAVNPQFFVDVLGKLKEKDVKIGLIDYQSGPAAVYPVGEETSGKYIHIFSLTD